jgi:ABC-type transport system substrate-binding protein
MKIIAFLSLLSTALAFAPGFVSKETTTLCFAQKQKQPFFLDSLFRPFHGHGTGETHMKEMADEERALMKDRQHYRKNDLKKKYGKESWVDSLINHPLHGHGSGENKLDEMYKAQQQLLYERREYYGNKDMLKKKYHSFQVDHHNEIKTIKDDPKMLNKKEDDAMWIDRPLQKLRQHIVKTVFFH